MLNAFSILMCILSYEFPAKQNQIVIHRCQNAIGAKNVLKFSVSVLSLQYKILTLYFTEEDTEKLAA